MSPSNFAGKMIVNLLKEKDVTQSSLSTATGVTPVFTNHITSGRRRPPADWLDLVSSSLGLPDQTRKQLHYSAALDLASSYGYDVDLTEPDKES